MKKFSKFPSWSVEAKAGLMLGITALTLAGGILIFNANNKPTNIEPTNPSTVEETPNNNSTETPVVERVEELIKPFLVNASVQRNYYDMNDDLETRAKAIVQIPGKSNAYMKSVGVDYSFEGKTFDIVAATSGVISDRISDSTYGNMIVITHESGIKTVYASLGKFNVAKGSKINQGDVIGTSGESLYTSELGNSLHFEIIKNEGYVNPEKSYSLVVERL